jgi:hypothetical protein
MSCDLEWAQLVSVVRDALMDTYSFLSCNLSCFPVSAFFLWKECDRAFQSKNSLSDRVDGLSGPGTITKIPLSIQNQFIVPNRIEKEK